MKLSDFDYHLPEHFIAQEPVEPRDSSRLMVIDRRTGEIQHRVFRDIVEYVQPGDVLVYNTTRVIPARLHAVKAATAGKVEVLLLRQLDKTQWHVLVRGRKVESGIVLKFTGMNISCTVKEELEASERIVEFSEPINDLLSQLGKTPLPPYIHKALIDSERYQTVYSRQEGSAAAPTAGLHFTPELLLTLRDRGVQMASCVLHIGLDTFQPVHAERITDHRMHSEYALLAAEDAHIINKAKLSGKRVFAVGTTSVRTLETAGILSAGGDPSRPQDIGGLCPWQPVTAFERNTDLFIYPGYRWRVVDSMITNFHLPKSTLLMMISSFATRELILHAYEVAKQEGYRFFSFGDAMLLL
jgi:S-adenosylmethionine:tRNA ribosyltransferase-isomerase